MKYYRGAQQRGHVNFDWLDSYHTFSFGNYYAPQHMGFSALRVINDDTVAPGAGFATHAHRDMEIISYILEGEIEHKDSMGNHFVVKQDEVQIMSAGTGITHSEYNGSETSRLKFLQIWVQPNVRGLKPGYQQKAIPQSAPLTALVTSDGRNGSLIVHQDASIYRVKISAEKAQGLSTANRFGYLHIVRGEAEMQLESNENYNLVNGDGFGVGENTDLTILSKSDNFEALWFDLPPHD